MNLTTSTLDTPVGPFRVALRGDALCAAVFSDHWAEAEARLVARFGPLTWDEEEPAARARFAAYFAGDLGALDDLAFDLGGTPFQARVWDALRHIPTGSTTTYAEGAQRLGLAPGASRAVGSANGANPVWVAIPCHRVIAKSGALAGYAGGIHRKQWLLDHESSRRKTAALGRETPRSK